jgi:hypothetical protein
MHCIVPDCAAAATHYSGDDGYCAPHAGIPPLPDTQQVAHWRYDPDDRSLYLWAPYDAINGPDDPPGRLWPVLKLRLATGQVLTIGSGTYAVGARVWEAVKAQVPADLGAQATALEGQLALLSARYAALAKAVAALEARAVDVGQPRQAPHNGLYLPGRN